MGHKGRLREREIDFVTDASVDENRNLKGDEVRGNETRRRRRRRRRRSKEGQLGKNIKRRREKYRFDTGQDVSPIGAFL